MLLSVRKSYALRLFRRRVVDALRVDALRAVDFRALELRLAAIPCSPLFFDKNMLYSSVFLHLNMFRFCSRPDMMGKLLRDTTPPS